VHIDPTVVLARATPEGDAEYHAFITQLRQLWGDIEPIPGQPWLSSVDVKNGVWVLGRKDYHAETRTFITYRVFRQVFVPLLFLGAYRVYEGPRGGLVFVGRHPLPIWARTWNAVVGALVLFAAYRVALALAPFVR
jgi:hypothetical protein